MLKTLKQKQRKYFSKTIVPGKTLKEVIYQGEGYQTSVLIIDQQQTISTCLRCKDPKCKTYLDDEFSLTLLQDFPSDTKSDTCCVDAIKWDLFDSVPHIEEEKCIGCGVCIERCPVGAIFFTNSRLAINISDIDSSEMINNLNDFANPQLQDVIYQGVKVPITQDSISSLYNNINRRKSMIEKCNKIDLTNYDFFDGYDGNNLDIKLLQKQNILGNDDELSNLLLNNSKYYKGTIGCALSHWYCWKEILKRNIEYCMILEDDICFCDDFKRRFIRMIKRCNLVDWNIIHLHSYTHEKIRKSADFLPDDNDIKSSTIYIGDGEGGGTKGYIISKKIIQNTFLKVYSKVISAADEMTWFGTSSFYTISGGFCIKPYLITRNRQNDNNTNNGLNNKYDVTYNYTNNIISSDRCIIDNNHTI